MVRRSPVAAAVLVLLVIACGPAPTGSPGPTVSPGPNGSPGPTASGEASPSPTQSVPIANLRFACGRFAFGAEILTAPPAQDQDASTPQAAIIREEVATAPPESGLPLRGWRLVGADAGHAEFVATGSDGNLVMIAVTNDNGTWTLGGEGACYAEVRMAQGVGAASWAWGSPGVPGPATQTFDALVTERSCASGRNAVGRIVGPVVIPTAEEVLVFFGVRPLPGGGDCQGNPPTSVAVDLGAPLGSRRLLDGGHLPFGDPTKPGP